MALTTALDWILSSHHGRLLHAPSLAPLVQAEPDGLMDTLIQLRQPQLSKKPDEASLSAAPTEALPPLSSDLFTDVSDAFNQLEEDRRQPQDYQDLARSVGHFSDRYGIYARTQTRRQARGLRGAQTGFNNASRALNDARSELEDARRQKKRRRSPTFSEGRLRNGPHPS